MRVVRRLRVTGRVQGVGYRAWTVEAATALGLDGWVRNRRDGSVEILAKGEPAVLDALAERCRTGPRFSRVDDVRVEPADAEPDPGFGQMPTL